MIPSRSVSVAFLLSLLALGPGAWAQDAPADSGAPEALDEEPAESPDEPTYDADEFEPTYDADEFDLPEEDPDEPEGPDEDPYEKELPPPPPYDGPVTEVFVSEFQASNTDAAGFAALLRPFLSSALAERPELDPIDVEDVPRFGEHSALVYLESCPPGDQVGCAWVVAKRVEASYAITGQVEARFDGTTHVAVTVIDVSGAREILGFEMELALGDDQTLADAVTELVVAVVSGDVGAEQDIREAAESERPRTTAENQMIAQQLQQLVGEQGDVTVTGRSEDMIERPKYTVDDLADDMASDAIPPWEQLDMPPGEYLRYKNAGLTLSQWRARSLGRKGQFTVRLAGGVMYGAVDTIYEGRYALEVSGTEFVVVEEYAWQTVQSGTGGHGGIWIGYGLLPIVELQVGLGTVYGRYTLRVGGEQAGDDPREPQEDARGQAVPWVGARVLAVPLQWNRVRPIIGGGVTFRRGYGYDTFWDAELLEVDPLDPPTVLEVQAVPGVEIGVARGLVRRPGGGFRVPNGLDITITVPIGVIVGGRPVARYQTDQQVMSPASYTEPSPFSIFSAGIEIGATARLGGATFEASREIDGDLMEDEEEEF